MKVFMWSALSFVYGFIFCWWLRDLEVKPATREELFPRGESADVRRVYLQAPGEAPKPEWMLRVVHACRSKEDAAAWRENKEVWRVYFAEWDTVIYLEARRGD